MAAHWGLGWRGASWERRRPRLRRWQRRVRSGRAGGRLWNRLPGCHANRRACVNSGKLAGHTTAVPARRDERAPPRRGRGGRRRRSARTERPAPPCGGGVGGWEGAPTRGRPRLGGFSRSPARGWVRTPPSLLARGFIVSSCLHVPFVTHKRKRTTAP